MALQNEIAGGIKKAGDWAGRFLSNGGHAQQDIPAQHRLFAAGGMFVGWVALDKLRDIMFGLNQVSEGEYHEIKREDVPAPLRFLHKTIDWNPHSDAPEDQWKKLAHQMLPAIGAGMGTVAGSMRIFEKNGRGPAYREVKNAKYGIGIMPAEDAAQHAQATPLRILTAATGGFSAASMMPFIYGAFLNLSFASANGARIFTGDLAMGNAGPAKSLATQLDSLPNTIKSAVDNKGILSDKWAEGLVNKVLKPMFNNDLKSPEKQEKVKKIIHNTLKRTFEKYQAQGLTRDELAEAVTADMKAIFGHQKDGSGIDAALKGMGLNKENATLGNAIPLVRGFNEFLAKMGIGKKTNSQSFVDKIQKAPDLSPLQSSAMGL
jgi:hypothetical protein